MVVPVTISNVKISFHNASTLKYAMNVVFLVCEHLRYGHMAKKNLQASTRPELWFEQLQFLEVISRTDKILTTFLFEIIVGNFESVKLLLYSIRWLRMAGNMIARRMLTFIWQQVWPQHHKLFFGLVAFFSQGTEIFQQFLGFLGKTSPRSRRCSDFKISKCRKD